MKILITLLSSCLFALTAIAQSNAISQLKPDPTKRLQIVETACGKCKLSLQGKSCELAIRINGKAYYVDGADIDSFGDAHAKDGFCNTIRKAEVQGEIVDNRFKATYFKLIESRGKKETKSNSSR